MVGYWQRHSPANMNSCYVLVSLSSSLPRGGGDRFPSTWPSILRIGRLCPWPVGKVALFLRPGQAGAQPRGAGHSAGPGVHGQRESGAGAALPATRLYILQADRLQLEALSPAPAGEAPETPGRSLESDPTHSVPQTESSAVCPRNYNSQEAARQRRRRRLRKRQRRRERWGRVPRADWSRASAATEPAENARQDLCLETSFLRLVVAAEAAWISASWRETIRAAVA